jgi:2-keto-3-deoxy-L-rhamnonate aldolase RhmA
LTDPERQSFRRRVQHGDTLLGMFINLGSPMAAELCGRAGYDWLLLDLEHGALTEGGLLNMLQAVDSTPATPVVRVEEGTRLRVGRALDFGAPALMIPRVESAAEASRIVSYVRYPPTGIRGVALPTRGAGYGDLAHGDVANAHKDICLFIQIEGRSALAEVGAIAAIDGVDVLFVGPSDLSHSLGIPGNLVDRTYLDAIDRVSKAAATHGKAAGVLLSSVDQLPRYIDAGYRLIAIGSDGVHVATAARDIAEAFTQRLSG